MAGGDTGIEAPWCNNIDLKESCFLFPLISYCYLPILYLHRLYSQYFLPPPRLLDQTLTWAIDFSRIQFPGPLDRLAWQVGPSIKLNAFLTGIIHIYLANTQASWVWETQQTILFASRKLQTRVIKLLRGCIIYNLSVKSDTETLLRRTYTDRYKCVCAEQV